MRATMQIFLSCDTVGPLFAGFTDNVIKHHLHNDSRATPVEYQAMSVLRMDRVRPPRAGVACWYEE